MLCCGVVLWWVCGGVMLWWCVVIRDVVGMLSWCVGVSLCSRGVVSMRVCGVALLRCCVALLRTCVVGVVCCRVVVAVHPLCGVVLFWWCWCAVRVGVDDVVVVLCCIGMLLRWCVVWCLR